ncbi:hypothetical protein HK097_010126 [Rhizophlyctis rosea]|uniref:Uncharacterized protein n=1 Tax=Rhizophlyctis rosea TaxID=64517 RepID=A0AAD5S9M1_9FUNG|nr:hypothetical protein HK097_010126 [Rhizophlyctis rosea]
MGFNSSGFPPSLSLRIYKAFFRPVLDFGLSLLHPYAAQLVPSEKLQITCLRMFLGAPSSSSRNAIRLLTGVHRLTLRNNFLHVKQWSRFADATADSLTYYIYRDDAARPLAEASPLFVAARRNPLWNSLRLLASLQAEIFDDDPEEPCYLALHWLLPFDGQLHTHFEALRTGTVAARLKPPLGAPHPILSARESVIRRRQTRRFVLWALGFLPLPTRLAGLCRKCNSGAAASYDHVIRCLNVPTLAADINALPRIPAGPLTLTQLHKLRPPWAMVARQLTRIWTDCYGLPDITPATELATLLVDARTAFPNTVFADD